MLLISGMANLELGTKGSMSSKSHIRKLRNNKNDNIGRYFTRLHLINIYT